MLAIRNQVSLPSRCGTRIRRRETWSPPVAAHAGSDSPAAPRGYRLHHSGSIRRLASGHRLQDRAVEPRHHRIAQEHPSVRVHDPDADRQRLDYLRQPASFGLQHPDQSITRHFGLVSRRHVHVDADHANRPSGRRRASSAPAPSSRRIEPSGRTTLYSVAYSRPGVLIAATSSPDRALAGRRDACVAPDLGAGPPGGVPARAGTTGGHSSSVCR